MSLSNQLFEFSLHTIEPYNSYTCLNDRRCPLRSSERRIEAQPLSNRAGQVPA